MSNFQKDNFETALLKLKGMLGLCRKAGKIIIGVPMVCTALRSEKPPAAVFISDNCSENTEKRVRDKCSFYKIPCYVLPLSTDELAVAAGKKSSVGAVAVTDAKMADAVIVKLNNVGKNEDIDFLNKTDSVD